MVLKTKFFLAERLKPGTPPNGTSLEEQMNDFLATLNPTKIADVQINLAKTAMLDNSTQYAGVVVYKE